MTYAHRLCEKASLDFSDLFAYQYLVSPSKNLLMGLIHFLLGNSRFTSAKSCTVQL